MFQAWKKPEDFKTKVFIKKDSFSGPFTLLNAFQAFFFLIPDELGKKRMSSVIA